MTLNELQEDYFSRVSESSANNPYFDQKTYIDREIRDVEERLNYKIGVLVTDKTEYAAEITRRSSLRSYLIWLQKRQSGLR